MKTKCDSPAIMKTKCDCQAAPKTKCDRQAAAKVGGGQQGQVLTEFVIMVALILVITAAMLLFFNVFTDYGSRAVSSVAVDYP